MIFNQQKLSFFFQNYFTQRYFQIFSIEKILQCFLEPINEVLIRQSRLENNDRGALVFRNTGEIGPEVVISDCSIQHNGYNIYGNISTTVFAVKLHLYNSLVRFHFFFFGTFFRTF